MKLALIIPFPHSPERESRLMLRQLLDPRRQHRFKRGEEPPADRGIGVDIAFIGAMLDEYYGERQVDR